jgi:polyribonucleotide nucleotidyltransferase
VRAGDLDMPVGWADRGRIGSRVGGQFVAFPTVDADRTRGHRDSWSLAASRDAIVMVEGGADQASEADLLDGLDVRRKTVATVCEMIDAQIRLRERGAAETSELDPARDGRGPARAT